MTENDEEGELDDLLDELQDDFQFMTLHDEFPLYDDPEMNSQVDTIRVVSIEDFESGIYHAGVIWPKPQKGIRSLPAVVVECLSSLREGVEIVSSHIDQEEAYSLNESSFSGTVFLYTESLEDTEFSKQEARQLFQDNNLKLRIRDKDRRQSEWDRRSWDVFISHDSSDSDLAESIHQELTKRRVKSWLDDAVLEVGDSLTQKIDEGLSRSNYAILIISENFVENVGWASGEWESLRVRATSEDEKVILPVWYDIDTETVQEFSHWLADKQAIRVSDPSEAEKVADEIISIVKS